MTAVATTTPVSNPHELLLRAMLRQLTCKGLMRTPPIWREGRMWLELMQLSMHPISRGVGFPEGKGRPVFLIPGYMAGDTSLSALDRALTAAGFDVEVTGFRLNVACASKLIDDLEARLESHVKQTGKRAVIIGQSRGGALGRWLVARRPDLVARLITLGTPLKDPFAVHILLLLNFGLMSALGALTDGEILSMACLSPSGCCKGLWTEATQPLPKDVKLTAIFSKSDGMVDWRACLDPAADHVEVDSSHLGMAFNVDTMRAIAHELGRA